MPDNRIWVGQDADVLVYLSNLNGDRLNAAGAPWSPPDGSLLIYCYLQSTTLSATVPTTRRPVTGRPQMRIINQAYEYELDVEHFYLTKDRELDLNKIFNREQYLELVLQLQAQDRPTKIELHTLKVCKATTFSISESDNENVTGRAKFMAERFE